MGYSTVHESSFWYCMRAHMHEVRWGLVVVVSMNSFPIWVPTFEERKEALVIVMESLTTHSHGCDILIASLEAPMIFQLSSTSILSWGSILTYYRNGTSYLNPN